MRWGLEHPNAYQLVYSAPRPPSASGWPEDTVDLSTHCYEIFSGVVREIAAEGRMRTGTANSAAQALWLSCHGGVRSEERRAWKECVRSCRFWGFWCT